MNRLDPKFVLQQVSNLKLLHPDIWDDGEEQLLIDSLEGQTDFKETLTEVVSRMREAASFAGGISGRIAELELRQRRYENRERAMRELAFKLMSAAEVRKLELSEATLSIVTGRPKLIGGTDANELPDDLCSIKREPSRSAIKIALESGQTVPGFNLSNAEPHLMIRTK